MIANAGVAAVASTIFVRIALGHPKAGITFVGSGNLWNSKKPRCNDRAGQFLRAACKETVGLKDGW